MRNLLLKVIFILLSVPILGQSSCLDVFLSELKDSKKTPSVKGFCYDPLAFSKFWKAGTSFSTTNSSDWKANYCYNQAYIQGFKVSLFNLEYSRFLVKRQELYKAIKVLNQIPKSDVLFQNAQLKKAEILIWYGSYTHATRVLNSIESNDKTQIGAAKKELQRRADSLSSPNVSTETVVLADNQPLTSYANSLEFRQGKSSALNYQFNYNHTFFTNKGISDRQIEIMAMNKFSFNRINTSFQIGMGISTFRSNLRYIGGLALKSQLNSSLSVETRFDRKVYDLTRGSIGSSILIHQACNRINYLNKEGLAFENYLSVSNRVNSNSNQFSWYSWALSPYLYRGIIKPRVGGFAGYSNSNQVDFVSVLPYDSIVTSGDWLNIQGIYPLWFTPNKMRVLGGIIDFVYLPFKSWTISMTNTIGYGISAEPFLYLGNNKLELGYQDAIFFPIDIKVNVGHEFSRNFHANMHYEFRKTVFNVAHQFSLTFSKRLGK